MSSALDTILKMSIHAQRFLRRRFIRDEFPEPGRRPQRHRRPGSARPSAAIQRLTVIQLAPQGCWTEFRGTTQMIHAALKTSQHFEYRRQAADSLVEFDDYANFFDGGSIACSARRERVV